MTKLLPPSPILIATVAGLLLVGTAWLIKPASLAAPQADSEASSNAVQVTRPLQRPYIDVTDTDGNGIPDWQETLQRSEPLTVPNATSSYEAPETLTGRFALEFFEQYVRSEQYGEFGASPEELVANSGDILAEQAMDQPITRSQIQIQTDTSVSALAQYGEQIASIINTHSRTDTEPELEIIDRAVRTNDSSELEKLDPIIEVYENILADTLELAVPQSYVTEHLILVNAYQAIRNDIIAMRATFTDPLRSLIRLQRYQDDATALNIGITRLYEQLLADGVSWDQDSSVFELIEIR